MSQQSKARVQDEKYEEDENAPSKTEVSTPVEPVSTAPVSLPPAPIEKNSNDLEQVPAIDTKPIEEPVSKDVAVVSEESTEILPRLAKSIEGEWLLDAYLLYEKGVELPMEVPVVYEPLELPKTWRFSKGKYKRVMDRSLSFTAKFEVRT